LAKIKTKAVVLLAEPKCELDLKITNVLLSVGGKVKSIAVVVSDEMKLYKQSFNNY